MSFRGEGAALEWADHPGMKFFGGGALTSSTSAESSGSWAVSYWCTGRGTTIGVGVHVDGSYVATTAPLRRRTRTPVNRLNRFLQDGTVLPLHAASFGLRGADRDQDVIAVLTALLAQRPTARERLGDRAVVVALLAEIRSHPHGSVPFHTGVRRQTLEVLNAMRALNFHHPLGGRPLPDETVSPLESVVPAVLSKVRSNPYAQGLTITEEDVRQVAERHYTSVQPWPFGALLN